MLTYSFKRLGPRLVTAAAMKWMKWISRSPVERAAATALIRSAKTSCLADNNRRPTLRRDRAFELNEPTKTIPAASLHEARPYPRHPRFTFSFSQIDEHCSLFAAVDRLLLKTMANDSRYAQIFGGHSSISFLTR